MAAYYNELDPYAADWLRNLIAAGHIPEGDVDERDIRDIRPDDIAGYTQRHFFAGIGGWALALRLAGWPDDRPVWTGSCPCQPFSAAGRRGGVADERHLWPHWFHLIEISRPRVVFGEQVASKDGLGWLDLVQADMEGTGYAFGALDLCAAGFGAPHIRQRLGFVAERMADATTGGRREEREDGRGRGTGDRPEGIAAGLGAGRGDSGMADADCRGSSAWRETASALGQGHPIVADGGDCRPGPTNGVWSDPDWLFCRDGKWRPVESGAFPLAHGISGRVGRLRTYGNAIVPQVWAEFIEAYVDARADVGVT